MIATDFLNEVAGYAQNRIGKVILNSEYEVENVQKTLNEHVINLEYMVPKGAVENINTIEVKATDGGLISKNEVFIPITSDTVIKQTLFVEEV
ncbi:ketopantoate hydroxymethyltransferase [Paenibacillus larvae subsp. pulvifaciens]|uniref:Ketopantoate hydroxymethyltransferase n=1 Tax=Paenibacillus larvae subsp. pulvifaciens TaxID=1477 RepID=A0A1V0UP16_9BACL|nr:ketopantoate hydroxymethyltransferase [Paenibacillus larvae]ARF66656.1 ketopantoate hydroxymethyltransferase [Paenibacillus larvae subsp. pulvifaciens]ARF67023.1 ketopantoate hydroxymethyltransferase [Paenibacillus larvae subsp. pulvifaciens]ARF69710.1 ketopantoate hydroxymethyltransferase [Paenibacillus larvae subsp. pulvifaciens]